MKPYKKQRPTSKSTSWQTVAPWYNKLVGSDGHYYHEHVVLPNVVRLLDLDEKSSLLDLGCGQGVLANSIPRIAKYVGIDAASALVVQARNSVVIPDYSFKVADVTKPLPLKSEFSHVTMILSLQNMSDAAAAINNAAQALLNHGTLIIVLNHPSFRVPRQSGWQIDEKTKQQSRWVNRYSSPLEVPIQMNPGRSDSKITWSFHHSLHDYAQMLKNSRFAITNLEEWASDKESMGKAAKMENRARSEFPLFMCIVAEKY